MSLDAMGRVIVGSGHFANQMPVLLEGLPKALDALGRVFVGGGHDQVISSSDRVLRTLERVPINPVEVMRAPASNVPHYSDLIEEIKHHADKAARAAEKAQRYQEANEKSLKMLVEAGGDFLQSMGYSAAGDIPSAMEKAVDAGVKTAEAWWIGEKAFWDYNFKK